MKDLAGKKLVRRYYLSHDDEAIFNQSLETHESDVHHLTPLTELS